ncbi:zinc finger, CCHC-type containing protein [Tanacetum coccineum]
MDVRRIKEEVDPNFLSDAHSRTGPVELLPHLFNRLKHWKIQNFKYGDLDQLCGALSLLRNSSNLETLWVQPMEMGSKAIHVDMEPASNYLESPGCLGKALDGLKTIEIVSVEGSRPELLFIKILLDHSLSLEKMIIRPRTTDDPHKMLKITRNKFRSERKNWESSQNNFKKETDSNSNKFTHDKSKVLCFKCKEYGHFANKCPSKKEEQSNLIEEDLEPTLLMATVEEAPGRVGSENLDGGVTESMSRPGIKEDIYAARTPIGRQSVGSITNQKHDQSGFMIDHNNEGGSNQKNMINLDLRKITTMKVEKMDQEDLKTYDKAIVIKEENVGLIPICWRQRQLQNSYS